MVRHSLHDIDRIVGRAASCAVALFQPLRHRIQASVDRRFDRARYDGERAVFAFVERIRAEVDLRRLEDALVSTTSGTVRSSGAAVWLRVSGQAR